MRKFLNQFIPFFFLGFALVALAFGIMLLAHLFLLGAVVGGFLYLGTWIREKFFTPPPPITPEKSHGRIIDSNDWRKM